MVERIVAVDVINGMTYIGEDTRIGFDLLWGSISIENYAVIPTEKLSSDLEKSFCEKAPR